MESYPRAAVEAAMKVQEVILRATAKTISWWQAAEIIGISGRSMRRWRKRCEQHGYDRLPDRRRGKPSGKRVPLALAEHVLGLYRERYFDLNVRRFREKPAEQHGIRPIYHTYDETIRRHVFCSFLTLLLRKELEDRLTLRGRKMEWTDVIRNPDSLAEMEVAIDGEGYVFRGQSPRVPGEVSQACVVALPPVLRLC